MSCPGFCAQEIDAELDQTFAVKEWKDIVVLCKSAKQTWRLGALTAYHDSQEAAELIVLCLTKKYCLPRIS